MNAAKKSPGKSKAKAVAKPEITDRAGDYVWSNIWFKIGLSKPEAALLKIIGVQCFEGNLASAKIARILLQVALAHFDKLEPILAQSSNYAEQEGFRWNEYLIGCAKHQQAMLLKPVKIARK